jgi:3-keto-disaccharide hydrolase
MFMTRWATLASVVLVSALAAAGSASGEDGFVSLFDGKSLDGFSQTGEANWRIEDGAIVADKGKGGHLVSKESYKDLHVRIEFWSDEKANSGIFIRCAPDKIGAKTCYEFNIFDTRPDQTYGTGSIVYIAEVNPMPKAAGKWNTMEAIAKGRQLTIVFNGVKTVDVKNGLWEEGHFTLQYGGGAVKFRKVEVKKL